MEIHWHPPFGGLTFVLWSSFTKFYLWYPVELNHDLRDFTPVHISILPRHQFVCQDFLIDYYFLIIEFIFFKHFLKSPAEDSNFLLSICSRIHTSCLPAGQFAESKGLEPLHRINDDGLANHYNTTLSTLHFIADEKRFELLTRCLTNTSSAVELFIHFTFCWPAGTRTLNSRCKRPVLLIQLSYEPVLLRLTDSNCRLSSC